MFEPGKSPFELSLIIHSQTLGSSNYPDVYLPSQSILCYNWSQSNPLSDKLFDCLVISNLSHHIVQPCFFTCWKKTVAVEEYSWNYVGGQWEPTLNSSWRQSILHQVVGKVHFNKFTWKNNANQLKNNLPWLQLIPLSSLSLCNINPWEFISETKQFNCNNIVVYRKSVVIFVLISLVGCC